MKENFKVGIIGRGFVGSAVQFGFSPNVGCDAELRVYDKDISKSTHTLEETVNESDFIFLSVPTPSNADGSMNIDILEIPISYNGRDYKSGKKIKFIDAIDALITLIKYKFFKK